MELGKAQILRQDIERACKSRQYSLAFRLNNEEYSFFTNISREQYDQNLDLISKIQKEIEANYR